MTTTIERTLQYGLGYAGHWGIRCYIARIHGTDQRYGLQREFLTPAKTEREHYNRARTMVRCTWHLEAGLYELSETGDRWIVMVRPNKAGALKTVKPSDERVRAILALLDAGHTFEAARLATRPRPPAKARDASADSPAEET